jgi:hypothetical protein
MYDSTEKTDFNRSLSPGPLARARAGWRKARENAEFAELSLDFLCDLSVLCGE